MHENREISCTSWLKDRDRSAKAINRTADVNGQEKSDGAVVPVNRPNKAAQVAAEAGEGRARTKENIVQSHRRPTQSGKGSSQGLHGVRQAAKDRKQERFTALLHHLSVALLRDSFYALRRQASPGVDGMRWQEYETGLEDRLADLHSRVHRGVYRAQPSRRVYIPKADGRQRLPVGHFSVGYDFVYDGGKPGSGGTGTLFIDGEEVATGRIERTIPFLFGAETADVGMDLYTPATSDYAKGNNKFTGKINKVTIDLKKMRAAEETTEKEIEEMEAEDVIEMA